MLSLSISETSLIKFVVRQGDRAHKSPTVRFNYKMEVNGIVLSHIQYCYSSKPKFNTYFHTANSGDGHLK